MRDDSRELLVGVSAMDVGQVGAVAGEVVPYVTAAAAVYGRAVWEKVQDQAADAAADATVSLGRRILQVLVGRAGTAPALTEAVIDVAEHPDDEDFQVAVRAQLKKALAADPGLLAELAALLPPAGSVVAQQASADRGGVVNQAGRDLFQGDSRTRR